MRLEPARQIFLFEVRSETFQPRPVGRATWSFVELGDVDAEEIRSLVVEAWRGVASARQRTAPAATRESAA